MVNLGRFSVHVAGAALLALPASADAFDVFQERCVAAMFAFEDFSGEGLEPTDAVPGGLEVFTDARGGTLVIVAFDAAPERGRRACGVETPLEGLAARFEVWVADRVAREELEAVTDTAWLTTDQVEPRLAVEISADENWTAIWLTETNLEADEEPFVTSWAVPGGEE